MSEREALARVQAELVRALGLGGPVPEGFDAERVRAAADALLSKRRRGVRRAWPLLSEALGEDFSPDFDAWARAHPLKGVEPHAGADGYRYANALRASGRLPVGRAEEELLRFELRWRLTPEGGVVARRGWVPRLWRVGKARRWVLGMRLPGGRLVCWRLPG
ncbi:hypothetical protein [Melittangium boletus]|uniref:SCO6045-like C-terminal domain-containing protein n=1 Tax=Melittangium boletus DSM 14713 TaxID=1294270 RepID=A0A250IFG3_9BACT|nr:hypothetical protein [Melittangium boletus]ATB29998.1 hypothetical protein MEBOL_003453 [Melittangium boletus DSM 14713]